jgi:hypothetical protein
MLTDIPLRLTALTVALVTVLSLGACKDHTGPATPLAASKAAADVPPAATAVSGEGSLPVELRFSLAQAPKAGSVFPLSLLISSATPQPTLRVQAHGDDGLEVREGAESTFDRLEPTIPVRRDVTLQASTSGIHLVTVVVAIDLAGGAPARTFTVPVLVATP